MDKLNFHSVVYSVLNGLELTRYLFSILFNPSPLAEINWWAFSVQSTINFHIHAVGTKYPHLFIIGLRCHTVQMQRYEVSFQQSNQQDEIHTIAELKAT